MSVARIWMSLSLPFLRDWGWESNTPPDLLLRVGDMSDEDDEDLDDCASSLAVLRVLTTRLARDDHAGSVQ